ncbi:amphi-Trp domain-containing protein [Nocardia sp. NPDC005746]|uniref:amphi-Trp domain-containing protein n=1 Tax=unclassified Nocardia TaxID=2637762 RepID=UPI0034028821
MTHRKIYEEQRTLDRVELADQLRELADELDARGAITYGSGGTTGTLILPDKLRGEVEITRSDHDGRTKVVARLRFTGTESDVDTEDEQEDDEDADWEIDDPYA